MIQKKFFFDGFPLENLYLIMFMGSIVFAQALCASMVVLFVLGPRAKLDISGHGPAWLGSPSSNAGVGRNARGSSPCSAPGHLWAHSGQAFRFCAACRRHEAGRS